MSRLLVSTATIVLSWSMIAEGISAHGGELPARIREAAPAVVTILAYIPEKAMPSIGTGFFIGAGRVVTVRHLLAGADRAEVRTRRGDVVAVRGVLAEDRDHDTALLELEAAPPRPRVLELSSELPEVGERLFTLSAALGLEWTASVGIVSALREVPELGIAVQHTVPVSQGSSGCPLLNLEGEVVAIQIATITARDRLVQAGQSLNFAVPAARIREVTRHEPRPLADCRRDLPAGWVPPVTAGIDRAGLRPLVRDDFRGALAFFEEAIGRSPDEPDAWFRLGLCHEKMGEHDAAVAAYKKALELSPDLAVPWNNLGVTYMRQGLHEQAVEALSEAVRLRHDYTEALSSLAASYLNLERYARAREAATRAIASDSTCAEAHYTLAVACLKTGGADRARKEHRMLLKLDRRLADQFETLFGAGLASDSAIDATD